MLSEKEKPLCSRQRFIVIFCFQNSQANNADAATIKALPANDSSIGAANGHNSNATSAEAACSLVMCFFIASAPLLFSCDRLPKLLYCDSFSGKHQNKTLTDCSRTSRRCRTSRKCAGGNNAARARLRVLLASDPAALGGSSPLNKRFGDCWLV